MKYRQLSVITARFASLPVRGAWVEIEIIEDDGVLDLSLPVRGAWGEIGGIRRAVRLQTVAPRAGSVG